MATYYLNNSTGSDGNAGTSAGAAWETWGYALGQLSTGDTLYVEATSTPYAMANVSNIPACSIIGSAKPNPITGVAVKVDGSGGDYFHECNAGYDMTNIWFNDFGDSSIGGVFYLDKTGSSGHNVFNWDNCIFSNLYGRSSTAGRGGIFSGGSGVSGYGADSLTWNMTNCKFVNLEAYSNIDAGVAWVAYSAPHAINLDHCDWYSTTPSRYALDTIVGNYGANNSTVTLTNCNISNNSGQTLGINTNYSGAGYTVNYAFTFDGGTYTNIDTTSGTITNSSNSDALYIDPANWDFRLQGSSPAINRGEV